MIYLLEFRDLVLLLPIFFFQDVIFSFVLLAQLATPSSLSPTKKQLLVVSRLSPKRADDYLFLLHTTMLGDYTC
jgi:hypothetical protein